MEDSAMLARNETILKWGLYAAASLLFVFVQGAVLQRLSLFGVIPFVYPLLAAIPATYEGSVPGTAFALAVGVFCDVLLPAPLPCFYTIVFPLAGLCGGLLSQSVLPAGFLCSAVSTAAAFVLTDLFQCFLLWINGRGAWSTGLSTMTRELVVSLPLVFPATALYRAVHRKIHYNE